MAAIATVVLMQRRQGALRAPMDKVSEERLLAFEKTMQEMRQLKQVLTKYDTNRSHRLEEDQVKKLLTDINHGEAPSDLELCFIIKLCDSKCSNGAIDLSELKTAIESWKSYLHHRDKIQEALSQFDKSGTGKLERPELQSYLVHLNGGLEVTEQEVDWVLSQADVFGDGACSTPELVMATGAWYTHVEDKRRKEACCAIS
mmetsp:Transcript_94438/g.262278  ORF Transcript_94438/g.262278 Transcript_94438/m.262278 type:complete len:201 (+) Transcript_94438:74-676(+)